MNPTNPTEQLKQQMKHMMDTFQQALADPTSIEVDQGEATKLRDVLNSVIMANLEKKSKAGGQGGSQQQDQKAQGAGASEQGYGQAKTGQGQDESEDDESSKKKSGEPSGEDDI